VTWCSAGAFANVKSEGKHAFLSGGSSGLTATKQTSQEANPSLASTATAGKGLISQPPLVQAAPRQEKGPLAQVIGAAGPNGVLVREHVSSLWSLACLTGSSSHRLQTENPNQ